MAKPAKVTRQTTPKEDAPAVDLDALIRSLPYGDEARRLFPDAPDVDRDRYPATISPTAPEDSTWRKSFKVWGCDIRDKANTYWPYAFPTAAPLHPDMGYITNQHATGYTLIDRKGNPTQCVECKQYQSWQISKSGLWQCPTCC